MTSENIQCALQAILTAIEPQRPPIRDGYAGMWSVEVPYVKPLVPIVRDYARSGRLDLQVNGATVAAIGIETILAFDDSDTFDVQGSLNGKPHTWSNISFVNDAMRDLFVGRWADFGSIDVRFSGGIRRLPEFRNYPNATKLTFDTPLEVRWQPEQPRGLFGPIKRLLGRASHTVIESVTITADGADFDVRGLRDWIVPDLNWV